MLKRAASEVPLVHCLPKRTLPGRELGSGVTNSGLTLGAASAANGGHLQEQALEKAKAKDVQPSQFLGKPPGSTLHQGWDV